MARAEEIHLVYAFSEQAFTKFEAMKEPFPVAANVAAAATVRPSKKGTSQHVLIIYM